MTVTHRLVLLSALLLAPVRFTESQEPELRFDRITPAELEPYVQRILDSASRSLERLLAQRGPRTVANTLRPYDDYRIAINRARVVSFLTYVHPDSAVRSAAVRADNLLTAFNEARRSDRRIYAMFRDVDTADADAEVRLWLRRELENFKQESVDRDSTVQARVAALKRDLDRLAVAWGDNPRYDTVTVAFDSVELEGMNPPWLAARPRNSRGQLLVSGDEMRAVSGQATKSSTRERAMLVGFRLRRNSFVLDTMLHRRYELATLLGYRSYAEYQLRHSMAGSPEKAREFLNEIRRLSEPALRAAVESRLTREGSSNVPREIALHDLLATEGTPGGPGGGAGAALRPYLPYTRVRDGIFDLAREFLNLEFRAAPDLPVWHPTVEPYRVFEDGRLIAKVYLDLHWSPGRSATGGGAHSFRLGVSDRAITEAALTGGMVRALPGEPALLGPRPMETLFHEFGHLLHILLSVRPWFATSGLPNDFDFREVPSNLFEAWGRDSAVVSRFARHYQTGEPAPPELLARLRIPATAAGFQGQFFARMSLEVHDRPPGNMPDVVKQAFKDAVPPGLPYSIKYPKAEIHPEVALPHLGNGYDAAYYTYLWSQAIAQDLLTRFNRGLLDREAIQAYRKHILAPGRSRTATDLVEGFLGRPFSLDAWARQAARQ